MPEISEQEKIRRGRVNASVIGTGEMEGIQLDETTLGLMRSFEQGELSRAQLSAAIDAHVAEMLAEYRSSHVPQVVVAGAV